MKVGDSLKPEDKGKADLAISAEGRTIAGTRTTAQYYTGSTTRDAGPEQQGTKFLHLFQHAFEVAPCFKGRVARSSVLQVHSQAQWKVCS